MANSIVQKFRAALAQQGVVDPRSDDEITTALGQMAEQDNRGFFDANPDFASDYRAIREANAPSLPGEFGRALKSGTQGMASTALGGAGLFTGSDYLKEKAKSFDDDAAQNAPTIPTLEDIGGAKDALRYGIAKVGSVAPSIAEAVATGAVGAAIGSAAAPGPGTIAGGAAGVLEKGLVKSAIRALLARGEATTAANIAEEAAAIGARRGGLAASTAGSVVLNSGDVASEGADTGTSVALGLVSALPDTILPAYVLSKLFPGVAKKEAVAAGKSWLAKNATKIGELAAIPPAEFGQEYFQEAVNVVARNIKDGKDPLTFDDADLRRLREAGIAGAAGGLLAAPGVMLASGQSGKPEAVSVKPLVAAPTSSAELRTPNVEVPAAPVVKPTASAARRVALMSDEDRVARLEELTARAQALTADEQGELSILQALSPSAPSAAVPEAPEVIAEAPKGGMAEVIPETPAPAPIIPAVAEPQLTEPALVGAEAVVPAAAGAESAPAPLGPEFDPPDQNGWALHRESGLHFKDGVWFDTANDVATFGADTNWFPATELDARLEAQKEQAAPTPLATEPNLQPQILDPVRVGDSAAISPAVAPNLSPEPAADGSVVTGLGNPPSAPTNPNPILIDANLVGGADAVPSAVAPVVSAPAAAPVEIPMVPESPSLEQRLREELAKPPAFSFGTILEGPGTIDLRNNPRFEELTPEQAAKLTPKLLGVPALSEEGNRAKTRVAIVLEAPDGHYVKAGLLVPQEMAQIGGAGERDTGPAVQAMAGETRKGGTFQKLLKEGGNRPALLADVIAAGYKLRAIVNFDADPGTIFQRFENRSVYDASFARTEKSNGTAAAKTIPTLSASEGVERRNVLRKSAELQQQIDTLGAELSTADPARAAEINDEISTLYRQLSELPEPKLMTAFHGTPHRVDEFSTDKIGSGEGAASYGWGLYFAENPDVARQYQKNLSAANAPTIEQLKQYFQPGRIVDGYGGQDRVVAFHDRGDGRWAVTVEALHKNSDGTTSYDRPREHQTYPSNAKLAEAGIKVQQGNFYAVDIADEAIAKMLDWDAPLSDQPEAVKRILTDNPGKPLYERNEIWNELKKGLWQGADPMTESEITGADLYRVLAKKFGFPARQVVSWAADSDRISDDKAASEYLNKLGVPGIKYLDQGSRSAGSGTRNFVVFDGKTAKILEENGLRRELPKFMNSGQAKPPVAVEQDRTNQFAAAAARLKQAGAKTDIFARTFLQANVADELGRRIDALAARYASASEAEQPAIQAQMERLQKQIDSVEQVRGVAYSPWHIAVGLEDVQNQNVADLVALLHEGGHAILGRDPVMQGRVLKAVDGAMAEIQKRLAAEQEKSGVREVIDGDPEELIVSTVAQRLANEGIPDAPSVARAIWQWVKDLYYRTAMAVQAAFGREPDGRLALDWFENQMRRVTGGDFDWRFANIFDRWSAEPAVEQLHRNEPDGGTPGNFVDFHDPLTRRVVQPSVVPDTVDGVNWNLRFMVEDSAAAESDKLKAESSEQDIPAREAGARIMGAAIAEEAALAEKMFTEVAPEGMTFDQFWALAGRGDTPKLRLAAIDQQVSGAGTATIGGERMTAPMNDQARVQAKRLLQKWQWKNLRRIASDEERSARAEKGLIEQAKLVNKIEGDLRNAAMHEATLSDKFKDMVRELSRGMRRGYDAAFATGELAAAVREAEGLSENEAIPEEYQKVFRAVLVDEVRVFDYLNAIAKLDMPLHEMTREEILSGIRDNAAGDPVLSQLLEPRNKPLRVALVALAKKNAEQMDLLQLRAVKDPEKYLAIKADLNAIRNANETQLKAIATAQREGKKATTFADRIKQSYLAKRAKLRRMQEAIQESERRREVLTDANAMIGEKLTEIETNGLTAPSEWTPAEGAEWTAMVPDGDGWKAEKRTLRFTDDGPAVDAERVKADLVQNRQWLAANADRAGSKLYETVKRQTFELQALDLQQRYPEGWRHLLDKMIQPLGQAFASAGHASGARIQQMLNNFQFINKSYWHGDLEPKALEWTAALRKVEDASGIKDHGAFFSQVYDPVLYFIQTEPGKDEGPVLREAVAAARKRLPAEPAEGFDEAFKDFLRKTKGISERFVAIAEQHGAFVKDPRLGGELRRAVAQGWLTVMRRVNSSAVSAIVRDMENAGWKIQFDEDAKKDGQPAKVVRTSAFDGLMPDRAANEQDEAARSAVLENPQAFAQAISGFFTPNIVRTWLEPFVNKPGEPVFRYRGEAIDPLEVQQAWQDAGGKVGEFIDRLGAKVGLVADEDEMLSPEAAFRVSMLRQMGQLFVMESRMAYESAQTKNLFDPMGPKPHVVMDARLNNLIPPEHLQHVVFDPMSAKNLLATLAFHGAFGRNGERMTRALDELKSNLAVRKNEFDSLTATTESGRKAEAAQRGFDYTGAKRGAESYRDVLGLQESLKAQFGFNQQAGVLGDMRTGLEMLHFVTGQTVNNPKTALLNLLQPASRALVQRSLGGVQAGATGVAYAEMAKQVFGSILENFGLHILRASEHAKDIGVVEGQGYGQLPWSVVMSDIGKRGRFQESAVDQWAIRPLRQLAAAQRKGVRVGLGDAKEFPRLNVIPGIGGVMNYLSTIAATSNGKAEVWALERIVKAGMDFFAAHPEKANDPAYRLTADELGLKNRAWFSDEGSFDYYRRKTVEYGVGNLEEIIRGAMDRQTKGEPILTREQALRTALLANNELDLQASINTRPAGWSTNPILKFGLPLMGWPIAQMNQVHQALKTADGRASWMAALKGLGIMAAWSLPIGLAFTLMTDEYDDKVLKKKSGLAGIDPQAAIPLVGPALALAAGDKGLANVQGILERMSKAGNIYGVGADALAQTLSSIDPTSGQRPFSLDQRVLVFSQFLNLQQAISNWINQGGTATYASVERPILQAIGGNGALHAMDIFNGVFGLDNQEARIVQRTNASQWLRAAGRETGLELRASGGGSVAPTPVSVWLREMQLAAYANDNLDFQDAFRRAVDAARAAGDPDPEAKVVSSWKSRNPLDVFRTKPDSTEMAKMYSVMSDNGKEAVESALRLYQRYTDLISVSDASRYEHRILKQVTRVPDISALRARMAGNALAPR